MPYIVKGLKTGYDDMRRHYVEEFPLIDNLVGSQNVLLSGEITKEIDKPSSFTFGIAPTHPHYDYIITHTTYVDVIFEKNGEQKSLFYGRIISWEMDLSGVKTVTCEGCMAFLADEILPQQTIKPTGSYDELWDNYIAGFYHQQLVYRAKVDISIDFYGPHPVKVYETDHTMSLLEVLRDAFVEGNAVDPSMSYPFHLVEDGHHIIITSLSTVTGQSQVVRYDLNLIDYNISRNGIGEFSTLICEGEDSLGRLINVVRYNNAWFDSDHPESSVERYVKANGKGWTEATLNQYADRVLAEAKVNVTEYDVTAFDMAILDNNYTFLNMRDGVPVMLHDGEVATIMMIKQITYNLMDPTNDRVLLGGGAKSVTDQIDDSAKATKKEVAEAATRNSFPSIYVDGNVMYYAEENYPHYPELGKGSTSIEANADLNTFTKVGTYFCSDGTKAGSIANYPCFANAGFKLVVQTIGAYDFDQKGSRHIQQTLYGNTGEMWVRTTSGESGWYAWDCLHGHSTGELNFASNLTVTYDISNALKAVGEMCEVDLMHNNGASRYIVIRGGAAYGITKVAELSTGPTFTVSFNAQNSAVLKITCVAHGSFGARLYIRPVHRYGV